ncbi:hypothetical protein V5T82_10335 [Magnetovibrio sp. PR-2]|uniref:hypothetical protein n=1 Tax=Magnetovibrio sp. PR-2 TaxID=3120356 RepID=UPI002FCE61DA
MYVIKTASAKDGDHFKGFETLDLANVFWKVIVAKASDTVGRKIGGLEIELYETDFPNEGAAIGAAKNGMAQCIRKVTLKPSHDLLKKVKRSGENLVTPQLLAEAQKVVDAQAGKFPAWAQEDFHAMGALLGRNIPANEAEEHIKALYKISYRLKGRGGTFGYQLITNVCDHLCNMLYELDFYNTTVNTAVETHLSTMKYVIAKDIKGDANEEDWGALLVGLERVASKIAGDKKAE